MKKSILVVIVFVLSLSMLLTACGGQSDVTVDDSAPVAEESSDVVDDASTGEEVAEAEDAVAEEAPTEEAVAEEAVAEEAPAEEAVTEDSPAASTQFAPMEGATEMSADEKAAVETVASAVADSAGLTGEYTYEAWYLPTDTTWDTVLAYYDQVATEAGWSADAAAVQDIENGKVAVFGGADNSMLVLVYVQSADQVEVLAIVGTTE